MQDHIVNPYASEHDISQIKQKTGLSEKSIRSWLNNQRATKKELQVQYFTLEDKIKMMRFYKTNSKHPGPSDLELLSKELKKDCKRIRIFFANERFLERQFLKRH